MKHYSFMPLPLAPVCLLSVLALTSFSQAAQTINDDLIVTVELRPTAGNASYYASKAARSGRRSNYSGRSDVMSPGCQIDGKARHEWLDAGVEFETGPRVIDTPAT